MIELGSDHFAEHTSHEQKALAAAGSDASSPKKQRYSSGSYKVMTSADCGCRRGSRQRMQNKIKATVCDSGSSCDAAPPCFCRAIRLTFLSLVDAVSLCFCFMLAFSRLSSLFSRLSSLFSRCCSFLRSLFALATSNFASGNRLRSRLPRPFAAPSLAWRNARSD